MAIVKMSILVWYLLYDKYIITSYIYKISLFSTRKNIVNAKVLYYKFYTSILIDLNWCLTLWNLDIRNQLKYF